MRNPIRIGTAVLCVICLSGCFWLGISHRMAYPVLANKTRDTLEIKVVFLNDQTSDFHLSPGNKFLDRHGRSGFKRIEVPNRRSKVTTAFPDSLLDRKREEGRAEKEVWVISDDGLSLHSD
jgi:hypothetical protein